MERRSACCGLDGLPVRGSQLAVEAGEATGQGGKRLRFAVAHAHQVQQPVEGDGWFSIQRVGVGQIVLGNSHRIHDDEAVFVPGVGGYGVEVGGEMTRTPRPFICSKKLRLRTLRMKKTTSTGLMSVPVAIMSTVTAMRGW